MAATIEQSEEVGRHQRKLPANANFMKWSLECAACPLKLVT